MGERSRTAAISSWRIRPGIGPSVSPGYDCALPLAVAGAPDGGSAANRPVCASGKTQEDTIDGKVLGDRSAGETAVTGSCGGSAGSGRSAGDRGLHA